MDRQPTTVTSAASDTIREAASAWNDLAVGMLDVYDRFVGAVSPEVSASRPTGRHRTTARSRRPCGCDRGHRDRSCRCGCRVVDADLVVHARLGELRVVPVRITNERQRSRTITLELSGFATSGGNEVPIVGAVLTRTSFELEACAHEDATIVIRTGGEDQTLDPDVVRETGRLGDVDGCVVGYADLRIQGCEARPVRIAVALLPRDCDAFEVGCGCRCC